MMLHSLLTLFFFFFNDTATTEIYTLSLHDALPISGPRLRAARAPRAVTLGRLVGAWLPVAILFAVAPPIGYRWDQAIVQRSEEHTSELQSRSDLVCRLLLEKKKKKTHIRTSRKL